MNRKHYKIISMFVFISLMLNVSFSNNYTKVNAQTKEKQLAMHEALTPLKTTVSFMNTGAHPDDERSDFLAYLSRGLGVETTSIIANRGEGGQNQIGLELGNQLGIIRTNEMIEAAKVTNVATYHLSEETSDAIYDSGFSKTPEETLAMWGDEVTYERFIREIRRLRPDIVMPAFRDVTTQHGHHRAMTQLTLRAFEGAADESVFPEHFDEGLKPWKIKKLYLPGDKQNVGDLNIDISGKNPIYDMTHAQLGEKSRYLHKSQGMGKERPDDEIVIVNLELVNDRTESKSTDDLFHNIPINFKDWAEVLGENHALYQDLNQLHLDLEAVVGTFNGDNYDEVFSQTGTLLAKAHALYQTINADESEVMADLKHKLGVKIEQLQHANYVASGLDVSLDVASHILVQGEVTEATVTLANTGDAALENISPKIITTKGLEVQNAKLQYSLEPNQEKTHSIPITVDGSAPYFDPYAERSVALEITYTVNGQTVTVIENTKNTVAVLPEISMSLNPRAIVINTDDVQDKITVSAHVKNYANGAIETTVGLTTPNDWQVLNNDQLLSFTERNESKEIEFELIPPRDITDGDFDIHAYALVNEHKLDLTVQEIDYDHIDDTYYLYPAKVHGVAFELLSDSSLKIGYVDSELDEVAQHLINFGFDITMLDETMLANGDLSQFDTIITGIRAYHKRQDLGEYNHRLIEYVKNGGHLVTQHNLPAEWNGHDRSPLPITVGSPSIKWRVTDETAAVTVTNPNAQIFQYPNKITEKDWENWIQERGLYFPSNWSGEYETFVSMKDAVDPEPFEGGILMAKFGEGTHLYTNLVFYRQIQNQVPGGYRLFTNLITPPLKETSPVEDEYDIFNNLVSQWALDDEIDEVYREKVKAARQYFDQLPLALQESIKTDAKTKASYQKLIDSEDSIAKVDLVETPKEEPEDKPGQDKEDNNKKPSGKLPSTGQGLPIKLFASAGLITAVGYAIRKFAKK